MTVFGDHPACRAQTVTVHGTGCVAAIGQHDAGRTVPRFHVHGVTFIKGAQVRVHGLDVLPGGRDQQAHGAEDVDATGQQRLEHVIQAIGIGASHRYQRPHVGHGHGRGLKLVTTGHGPVAVALDGVDFAVVGQVAERLGQPPLRPGIGGEALVEHAQR